MNDCLPNETNIWQMVESVLRRVASNYGFAEIRMPIVESTALFKRSIGEVTDIVEKEMYTFDDRNGDSLTLRPEGTASCVRAGNQHGLLYNQEQRLWYMGPMFRHERPQKGRYRQFHQFGVEAFGSNNPEQDVEIIAIAWKILSLCGLANDTTLNLNSIGSKECRNNYRKALKNYIYPYIKDFSKTSQHRFETNPLRILDTKSEKEQEILNDAPKISDYHNETDSTHFESLKEFLKDIDLPFSINHKLVRGLDYYTGTVFEFNSVNLGAQDALLGGGRYNRLVETLGGKPTPGIGFAAGMERFLIAMEQSNFNIKKSNPDIYFICADKKAISRSIKISSRLRGLNFKVVSDTLRRSMKSQLREANKLKVKYALIIGEDEIRNSTIILKNLIRGTQKTIPQSELKNFFEDLTI